MFEQLSQLVQQFGQEAVVENNAVPNEQNDAVLEEANNSIFSGLQNILSQSGGKEKIVELLQGNVTNVASNPVVQQLTEQLSGKLGQKFGLNEAASTGVAGNLIPNVLSSLVGNAKDPNHKGFEISDIVNAISGGNGSAGLMESISKYGTQFGLDQNADGKLDISDAMAVVEKKGGFGAILGKLFGK